MHLRCIIQTSTPPLSLSISLYLYLHKNVQAIPIDILFRLNYLRSSAKVSMFYSVDYCICTKFSLVVQSIFFLFCHSTPCSSIGRAAGREMPLFYFNYSRLYSMFSATKWTSGISTSDSNQISRGSQTIDALVIWSNFVSIVCASKRLYHLAKVQYIGIYMQIHLNGEWRCTIL